MEKTNEVQVKRSIWYYYFVEALTGCMFAAPTIVLFWKANGLSQFDVMILQSLFQIIMLISEIPTGYLADRIGRKITLVWATIFMTMGIALYSVGINFWQFLAAEALFAIGMACFSGADSAYVYDSLTQIGRAHEYKRVWGNISFVKYLAMAVSQVVGGYVAEVELRYALFVTVPFFAASIPFAMAMREPKMEKPIIADGYVKDLFSSIKLLLQNSRQLSWTILFGASLVALNNAVLWLYQPYFEACGLSFIAFGYVFASLQLFTGLSSKAAYYIEGSVGKLPLLTGMMILVSLSYFLMGSMTAYWCVSFCFIQQFVRGISDVVFSDYVNQATGSEIRATMISIMGMLRRLINAAIIPVVGWLADKCDLSCAFMFLGVLTFFSLSIILVIGIKSRVVFTR